MEESSDQKRPWWKTALSWFPRIQLPTGSALTTLLCLAVSGPALVRVTKGDEAGDRYDLEAGVLESITVYRLITYVYYHDDMRALACSCLSIWFFGGGFEENVGTVKFCFLTPLFAVCIGLIYLAVVATGLSLPVGDGRVQGFTAVAFCMMSAFSTRTRIRRLPFFGFMVPVRVLPFLFLFPALFIPHAPVFSNMCGILIGVLYGLGGCFCLDLPESVLSRLEQMLPFRLLKRIPVFKYIPASTAERNSSQTRKINPPPGSYPVQQYYTPPHDLPNSYSPYHHMKPAGNGQPYGHPAGSSAYPIGMAPGAFHQTTHVCSGGHSHTHAPTPSPSELTHVQTQ
ncbi:rhomboid domain-containing protein 2 [Spea bombifrons]|uniref:rhomboid domain-containing protein 2 n=1 Tax=Spea bombifrons TaxID=233779 RepID=UPI00234BDB3E|nr:rhomboid domain-containing protein 2 [Spea bombifrons]